MTGITHTDGSTVAMGYDAGGNLVDTNYESGALEFHINSLDANNDVTGQTETVVGQSATSI